MTLKDLFAKAENGTLNYEQLEKLINDNKLKFADLSEGRYVDKQKYTDELAARDTRITDLDTTIKNRDADLQKLQEQLKVAGTDAEKLTKLGTDFSDLQKKYEKDTKAYQKQLHEQAYKFAVNEFANTHKFTSQAAKRDFINSLIAKDLQMDNDVILGATDFVDAYKKDNADAFVSETAQNQSSQPHFVDTTSNSSNTDAQSSSPFNFNFAGVRPH